MGRQGKIISPASHFTRFIFLHGLKENKGGRKMNRIQKFYTMFTEYLKNKQFKTCKKCPLYSNPAISFDMQNVKDTVDIMFVGMNPYKDELKNDKPFAGRAGKLLRKYVNEIFDGFSIVYTNACMCFIENNGDPTDEALQCCKPILDAQIDFFKPKIIVALGSVAASTFLPEAKELPVKALRKIPRLYKSSALFVTYHPSACLRNSKLLDSFVKDLQYIRDYYHECQPILNCIAKLPKLTNWDDVKKYLELGYKVVDFQYFYNQYRFKHPLLIGIFKNPDTNDTIICDVSQLPVEFFRCEKIPNPKKNIGIEPIENTNESYMITETTTALDYTLIHAKQASNQPHLFNADLHITDYLTVKTRLLQEDALCDDLTIGYLDIEVLTPGIVPDFKDPQFPIIAFAFTTNKTDTIYACILNKKVDKSKLEEFKRDYQEILEKFNVRLKFDIKEVSSEIELLEYLQQLVKDVDILTSWNAWFDANYISERAFRLKANCTLSKLDIFGYRSAKTNLYKAPGIIISDMLETYKASKMKEMPSYKLDYIAQIELGVQKVKYEGTLSELYENDPTKFLFYNIIDTALIKALDSALSLYTSSTLLKNFVSVSWENSSSALAQTDALMLSQLAKENKCLRARLTTSSTKFPGGFNRDPQVGLFYWVIDLDASSMYPSIIQALNISPNTYVLQVEGSDELKEAFYHYMRAKIGGYEDTIQLPNELEVTVKPLTYFGQQFGYKCKLPLKQLESLILRRKFIVTPTGAILKNPKDEVGIFRALLDYLLSIRKHYKSLYLKAIASQNKYEIAYYNKMQKVPKIAANAVFGAHGNNYFRFYCAELGGAITLTGQTEIKLVTGNLDKFLQHLTQVI